MAKLGVTIPDDMDRALAAEAKRRGAPLALIVREAIAEYFDQRGIKISGEVGWGGLRTKPAPSKDESGAGSGGD